MKTELENDTRVLEDLDYPLECVIYAKGCDHKAEWILVHQCCGVSWYACEEHKLGYISKYAELVYGSNCKCSKCGTGIRSIHPTWVKM